MARIRTVKPEFWTDDLVGTFPLGQRLLFIATWNLADDEGLLRWAAPYLKGAVFPFDTDITVADVEAWMAALVEAGVIFTYVGGRSKQQLACIVNFHKHQRINRPSPSRLPAPSLQSSQVREMYAQRDALMCHICNAPVCVDPTLPEYDDYGPSFDHIEPRSSGDNDHPSNIKLAHVACIKGRGNRPIERCRDPDDHARNDSLNDSVSASVLEREREKEKEVETEGGVGEETLALTRSPPAEDFGQTTPERIDLRSRKRKRRLPDDFQLDVAMIAYAAEHSFTDKAEVSGMFEHFCDYHRSKGSTMLDWRAAWRNWVRNQRTFNRKPPRGGGDDGGPKWHRV